jgi:predicted RNA-binding protein with RPS1 domain
VELKVIKSDGERRKIRLSLREMQEDPWHTFVENYPVGTVIDGEITELKDFGAFCKITDEVEGLIHVSEIAEEHVDQPSDVLEKGQSVEARIIGVNEDKRQVRLSLRNVHEQHEAEKRQQATPTQPTQQRTSEPSRAQQRPAWPPEPTAASSSSSSSSASPSAPSRSSSTPSRASSSDEEQVEAEEADTGHEALTMRELLKQHAEDADLESEDAEATDDEGSEDDDETA